MGGGPWYVPQCSQLWGRWSSDGPACKTTAAKFAKCLESRRVSHLSPAQTNPKQRTCGKQESSSSSSAARLWKHASIPPPPSLLSTRSHAPHLQITITSLFILFDPSGPSAAVAKDRTSQISQTSLPCTCSPAGPPGFGTLRRQICARARSHATFCCQMFPLLLLNEQLLQAGENGRSLGLKPKAGSPGKSSHRSCLSSVRPSALSPAQHIWWDLRRRKWRA